MTTQIQLRRDTAANWTSNNPTLAEGELGFELDTNKFKIGDGSSDWNTLSYSSSSGGAFPDLPTIDPTTTAIKTTNTIPTEGITSAAYGNGVYVVGGWYGVIYYSTDGETWTEASNAFKDTYSDIYDIVFGNNLFVAVGELGLILTSSDGITWTQRASYDDLSNTITQNSYDLTTIAYGDSKYVAISWNSYGIIMTSSDGFTWTQTTYSGQLAAQPTHYNGVCFGDGYFVISGSDYNNEFNYNYGIVVYCSSTNLSIFNTVELTEIESNVVNFGNHQFVVGGAIQDVSDTTDVPIMYASSSDLSTWTRATSAQTFDLSFNIGYDYWGRRGLTYCEPYWFAGLYSSSFPENSAYPLIYSDDDGVTWQAVPNFLYSDIGDSYNTVTQISSFGDKVFVSGWYGDPQWAYLNDLTTWYPITFAGFNYVNNVNYIYYTGIVNYRLIIGTQSYNPSNAGSLYLTDPVNIGTYNGIVLGFDPTSATGAGWVVVPTTTSAGGSGINGATAPVTYDAATQTVALDYGTGLILDGNNALAPDFGSSAGSVTEGNDARLSDARTPTAHKTTHATGGTDALTAADIGAIPASTINAKGDLIVGTADNTAAKLTAGTNDYVLTADSAATYGVKWAPATGGGGATSLATTIKWGND